MNKLQKKAVFLGSKRFGLRVFKALLEATPEIEWYVICPEDRSDDRSVQKDFLEFTNARGIEIKIVSSSKTVFELCEIIMPRLIFCCGYYRILPTSLFSLPSCGVWGIHHSPLPKYRGGAPLVWQLINGEDKIGSTLFKMDENLDGGPIAKQVFVQNDVELNIGDILETLESKWLVQLPKIIPDILSGVCNVALQNEAEATYCCQRKPEDGRIGWKRTATEIMNFIRAQSSPYPGAFFLFKGSKIYPLRCEILKQQHFGKPGQIFKIGQKSVVVCCGRNTAIEIFRVRINGKIFWASETISSISMPLG